MGTPNEVGEWLTLAAAEHQLTFARRAMVVRAADRLRIDEDDKKSNYIQAAFCLLGPEETATLKLCGRVAKDEMPGDVPAKFLPFLRELVAAKNSPLCGEAMAALYLIGQDVQADLEFFFLAADQDARLTVLTALCARPTPEVKPLLLRVLREDEHFRCRWGALDALTKDAEPAELREIFDIASRDDSWPVRKACAFIIGEKGSIENLEILMVLLSDRQDRNVDLSSPHPEYSVARAAADSLHKIGALPEPFVKRIISFIGDRGVCDDIVVHYKLLKAITQQPSSDVMPLLEDCLSSSWRMEGQANAGFPLRYGAAWGIFWITYRRINPGEMVTLARIGKAAVHSDDRLAVPALFALGVLGPEGLPEVESVFDHDDTTSERQILYLICYAASTKALPPENLWRVLETHPCLDLIRLGLRGAVTCNEEWKEYLRANENAAKWIKSIQGPDLVAAAQRLALRKFFFREVKAHLKAKDFRKTELASGIPFFSFHRRY